MVLTKLLLENNLAVRNFFSNEISSHLRRFRYLLFWRETYPQTFPPDFMSICEYNSRKRTASYRPLKNRHFVGVCMEKMMGRQDGENGVINVYSNYNEMRACVDCSPNQSKKLYLIDLAQEKLVKCRLIVKFLSLLRSIKVKLLQRIIVLFF